MTRVINALQVRSQLGGVLADVKARQTRYLISKRGRAEAVLLSVDDFLKNIARTPRLIADIQLDSKKRGLDGLSISEIDNEIRKYRQARKSRA